MFVYTHEALAGFWVTLQLTFVGFALALVLGAVLAVFRVSPVTPLRVAGGMYVGLFRNVPLLALVILFVFGLPDIGVVLSLYTCVLACLALSGAAFVCEAIRSGLNSVPLGQAEAARAIGLNFSQCIRIVVLPQALRSMVGPLVNTFIAVALNSAVASAVGVADLTFQAQDVNLRHVTTSIFVLAGLLYMALSLCAAGLGAWLEKRLAFHR